MERELRNAVRTRVKNQVMDALADAEVDLPKQWCRKKFIACSMTWRASSGGRVWILTSCLESFRVSGASGEARFAHVRGGRSSHDHERASRSNVDDIAAPYDEPEQVKSWYHGNDEQMSQLRNSAIEEQVIDWLLEKMTVTTVTLSTKRLQRPSNRARDPITTTLSRSTAPDKFHQEQARL